MDVFPAGDPRAVIPHRPPALCIDTVLDVNEDRAVAERLVTADACIHGALWEPWLVEGLAQTAAVMHGASGGGSAHEGYLVGVRKFTITRHPAVDETIRFETRLITRMQPFTLVEGVVSGTDGDDAIAAGELKFYLEE